jgi:hypothetical protein
MDGGRGAAALNIETVIQVLIKYQEIKDWAEVLDQVLPQRRKKLPPTPGKWALAAASDGNGSSAEPEGMDVDEPTDTASVAPQSPSGVEEAKDSAPANSDGGSAMSDDAGPPSLGFH